MQIIEFIRNDCRDSRVIGVYGYSNTNVNLSNRKMTCKYLGQSTKVFFPSWNNYDKGAFHCTLLRRANPDTFVFYRPIYKDLAVALTN